MVLALNFRRLLSLRRVLDDRRLDFSQHGWSLAAELADLASPQEDSEDSELESFELPPYAADAAQPRRPNAASRTTREEGPVSYTCVYWAVYESILCSRGQYREERPLIPGNTKRN